MNKHLKYWTELYISVINLLMLITANLRSCVLSLKLKFKVDCSHLLLWPFRSTRTQRSTDHLLLAVLSSNLKLSGTTLHEFFLDFWLSIKISWLEIFSPFLLVSTLFTSQLFHWFLVVLFSYFISFLQPFCQFELFFNQIRHIFGIDSSECPFC